MNCALCVYCTVRTLYTRSSTHVIHAHSHAHAPTEPPLTPELNVTPVPRVLRLKINKREVKISQIKESAGELRRLDVSVGF